MAAQSVIVSQPAVPSRRSVPNSFGDLWDEALRCYQEETGKDLLKPLLAQDDPTRPRTVDDVTKYLEQNERSFKEFRGSAEKVRRVLKPMVDIALFLKDSAEGASDAVPGGEVIFGIIGVLLQATKGVSGLYNAIECLFDELHRFLGRVALHLPELSSLAIRPTPALMKIFVDTLLQALAAMAIATEYCNIVRNAAWYKKVVRVLLRRMRDYFRVLSSRADVKEVLQKLERLAVQEERLAVAVITASVRKSERLLAVNDFRAWLRAPDPMPLNYDAKSEDNSCAWFFDKTFHEWKSSKDGMYWVYGRAASGKSVLCSSVLEELKTDTELHLAYFYFDVNDPEKRSFRGFVSSLVVQLGTCSEEGFRYLDGERRSFAIFDNKDPVPMFSQLLGLSGRTAIVIDALDEFPKPERTKLLDFLKLVREAQGREGVDLRVLVTSRKEPDIEARMPDFTSHTLDFSNTSQHMDDIREYARSQLDAPGTISASAWSDYTREQVQTALMRKANGIFLWVKLQLPVLQCCEPSDVERVLDELPSGLNETYERILQNFPESKTLSGRVLRVFQCIAFARTPLSPDQIAEILSLNFDTEPATLNSAAKGKDAEASVLRQCPSLIEIVSDSEGRKTVQFIHLSVKEYLTSEDLQNATSESAARHYRFAHQDASITLAMICLSALVDTDNAHWECRDYADYRWDEHVSCGIDDAIGELLYCFLHLGSASFDRWSRLERGSWQYSYGGALHCAAYFGLCHHTKRMLERSGSACDTPASIIARERNAKGEAALHIAVAWGHDNIVRLLLDHGALIDDTNGKGEIALHLAAARGSLDTVRLLLSHTAIDGSSTAALQCSVRTKNGQTALHFAAQWIVLHSDDICRVLIEHGSLVDDADNDGNTPLHLAADSGKSNCVRLLLDHPASDGSSAAATRCRVRNNLGQTPLHSAASRDLYGNYEASRLLLECGALVDDIDNNGDTPLHGAATIGQSDIVRLLLENPAADGSDVAAIRCRARNQRGRTALHNAADRGWVDVCRVLLEHGASVGDTDNDGNTPLTLAHGDKAGYSKHRLRRAPANWGEVIELLKAASEEEQRTEDVSARVEDRG